MPQTISKEDLITQFAKQSPCICFNLRKASRAMTQIYDRVFHGLNLTASQMPILAALQRIGPMNVSQLAQAMATDRTTITRNLKPLVRENYIEVMAGADRRSRTISLTEKGARTSEKFFATFQEFQNKIHQGVGEKRLSRLFEDLDDTICQIQSIV